MYLTQCNNSYRETVEQSQGEIVYQDIRLKTRAQRRTVRHTTCRVDVHLKHCAGEIYDSALDMADL